MGVWCEGGIDGDFIEVALPVALGRAGSTIPSTL
jgi:hypothetical protein